MTKANAQIAMGSFEVDSREVSFNTCVDLLLREDERYRELHETQKSSRNKKFFHPNWDGKTRLSREYGDRERPHRPRIDSDVLERFEEQVAEEWPNIPTDDLSFDRKLSLLIDVRHKWMQGLRTNIKMKNETTGEEVPTIDPV